VALALGTTAFLVYASDRGINLFDEGYYLLASQHPEDVLAWSNSAHVYTAFLWRLAGEDLARFRLVGLVLLLAGGGVLGLGYDRLLDRLGLGAAGRIERIARVAFVELGVLLYYNLLLPSPCYNLLNAVALNTGAGLLCAVLASTRDGIASRIALAAIGLCAGVSFFVKFSSGISFLALAGVTLLVWPGLPWLTRVRSLMLIAGGLALWLGLHFSLLQPPAAWWHMIRNGIDYIVALDQRYGLASLRNYRRTFIRVVGRSLRLSWDINLALVVGLTTLALVGRRWRVVAAAGSRTLVAAAFVALAWRAYRADLHWRGHLFGSFFGDFYGAWVLLLLVALAAGCVLQRVAPEGGASWVRFLVAGSIGGLLPVAAAMGTRDDIIILVLLAMGPFFAALLLLLACLSRLYRSPPLLPLGATIIGAFACAQVCVRALWDLPYGYGVSVAQQTVETEIGVPPSRILLAPARSVHVATLRSVAERCGFRPGDDVLAFYSMPTLVFALGGRSPGVPWYVPGRGRWNRGLAAEKVLALVPRERLKRAFLLRAAPDLQRRGQFPRLYRFGTAFPRDYVLCGQFKDAWTRYDVELWKPRALEAEPLLP